MAASPDFSKGTCCTCNNFPPHKYVPSQKKPLLFFANRSKFDVRTRNKYFFVAPSLWARQPNKSEKDDYDSMTAVRHVASVSELSTFVNTHTHKPGDRRLPELCNLAKPKIINYCLRMD